MTSSEQLRLDLPPGQMNDPAPIRRYILGGNSTFTLRSLKTGKRITYKVKSTRLDEGRNWSTNNQNRDRFFVSFLNGPDNNSDYAYMGLLDRHSDGHYVFRTTAKSRASRSSETVKAFEYCWNSVEQGCAWPRGVEFFHEGSCCVCGRKLTTPESVASGIGPECASKDF